MTNKKLSNWDLYDLDRDLYPEGRCRFPDCPDEVIQNPNGDGGYCFKHYNYHK